MMVSIVDAILQQHYKVTINRHDGSNRGRYLAESVKVTTVMMVPTWTPLPAAIHGIVLVTLAMMVRIVNAILQRLCKVNNLY